MTGNGLQGAGDFGIGEEAVAAGLPCEPSGLLCTKYSCTAHSASFSAPHHQLAGATTACCDGATALVTVSLFSVPLDVLDCLDGVSARPTMLHSSLLGVRRSLCGARAGGQACCACLRGQYLSWARRGNEPGCVRPVGSVYPPKEDEGDTANSSGW